MHITHIDRHTVSEHIYQPRFIQLWISHKQGDYYTENWNHSFDELLVILGCGDERIPWIMDTSISEVSKHWSKKIVCCPWCCD